MAVDFLRQGRKVLPPFIPARTRSRCCGHPTPRRGDCRRHAQEFPPLHDLLADDTVVSMNDSSESSPQEGRRWLMLMHQVPPKPDYVRVKVRRRLHRLGAMPLKNSVYVLPETDEHLEDF